MRRAFRHTARKTVCHLTHCQLFSVSFYRARAFTFFPVFPWRVTYGWWLSFDLNTYCRGCRLHEAARVFGCWAFLSIPLRWSLTWGPLHLFSCSSCANGQIGTNSVHFQKQGVSLTFFCARPCNLWPHHLTRETSSIPASDSWTLLFVNLATIPLNGLNMFLSFFISMCHHLVCHIT